MLGLRIIKVLHDNAHIRTEGGSDTEAASCRPQGCGDPQAACNGSQSRSDSEEKQGGRGPQESLGQRASNPCTLWLQATAGSCRRGNKKGPPSEKSGPY